LAQRRARITSVEIAPADAAIQVGRPQVFFCTAYDAANNPVPTATCVFTSSNRNVATVDVNGIATGVGVGTTIITARVGTGATAKSAAAALAVSSTDHSSVRVSSLLPIVTAIAPGVARIRLPEVLAVNADSAYQLLVPSLYARREVFRLRGQEWTTVEPIIARDSLRGAREVVGKAVGLFVEGIPVGAGRVSEVQLYLCAEPPDWCPPRAVVGVIGALERVGGRVVAVSPPPVFSAETVEPTWSEVSSVSRALLAVLRAGAGVRVRLDQMAALNVYAVDDRVAGRRLLVAAAQLDLGGAGAYSGLVLGVAADTLLQSASGRATRLTSRASQDLQLVSAQDLNGDGALELLLGWLTGGTEWRFEILAIDGLGRWSEQWSGPDRTLPAAAGQRARR
jgi:hypothetical protein